MNQILQYLHFNRRLVEVQYQQTRIFGAHGTATNKGIVFTDAGSQKPFLAQAAQHFIDYHFFGAAAATVDLPRYRYTPEGERIDNVTDWVLKQFRAHYGKAAALPSPHSPSEDGRPDGHPMAGEGGARSATDEGAHGEVAAFAGRDEPAAGNPSSGPPAAVPSSGPSGPLLPQGEKGRGKRHLPRITKDDIFHYVYGVLHDPVYREKYALNLKREFPRIPFYPDFRQWADWGQRLMALHIGYEAVEPWPLTRRDEPDEKARAAGIAPKCLLKSDREAGTIRIDSETTLSGIPPAAFVYRLGNSCGLDWILDQYKEKTPKDPTIREKFNTYRFADYKEKVIDLIARVTRVSVETMAIVEAMKEAAR